MRLLPVLVSLLAASPVLAEGPPPVPAVKRVLLVWGGGKTAQEAEAAAKDYRERSGDWEKVLRLAEGYPRVVRSADVPGLKPGLHVAVLGVCDAREGAHFTTVFDALEPRTYSREVTWSEPGAPACPGLAEDWAFQGSALAKSKEGDLLVAGFSFRQVEGEQETHSYHLVLSAFDKRGGLLAARMEITGSEYTDIQRLEAQGATVRLVEREVDPPCHGSPTFQVVQRTWSFRLEGQQIAVENTHEQTLEEGRCNYPELGPVHAQEV
jgi:hypothetical protein